MSGESKFSVTESQFYLSTILLSVEWVEYLHKLLQYDYVAMAM